MRLPALVFLLLPAAVLAASPSTPPKPVAAFLEKHCHECHDADLRKGGLDLTALPLDFTGPSAPRWVDIHDRVRHGEMPPEKVKERPSAEEIQAFTAWLGGQVTTAQLAERADGRVPIRRLNRVEYENTVHDLLGIDIPLRGLLPEDTPLHGFDTVSDGLRLSALHLEKFLEAADAALDEAIQLGKAPEPLRQRFSFKDDKSVRENLDTPEGAIKDPNSNGKHRVILRETGEGVVFFGEGYPPAELRALSIKAPGEYRFRVSARGVNCAERPVVARFYVKRGGDKRLITWFDIPADAPREFEVTVALKPGDKIETQPWDCGHDENGKTVWNVDNVAGFTGRGLEIRWIEAEGPLRADWPPASTARVFEGCALRELERKQVRWVDGKAQAWEAVSENPTNDLRRLVSGFAGRAFRRPLEPAEAEPFVRLALTKLEEGKDFAISLRAGLRGVLTAPQFLLRMEKPGKLDPHALASRLSYFLWSRPPDAVLLARAADGSLTRDEVLRAEASRLLADPRSAGFVSNFAGQWLDLRAIAATSPDAKLYPEFDELLEHSMVMETEGFVRELIERDLPLSNLVDSDFLMINRRLAEHYGIEGVQGEPLRRVARPVGSPRGGLLTQAAILKVTANGTVSSPVLRGAWVMKRLLGQEPRPPPADVGSIEPDTRGATTVREQLDKHRTSESCAACHRVMDPPGFALESFDVIGGWRERYRSQDKGEWVNLRKRNNQHVQYKLGPPVDASGALADGRVFSGISEFKALLASEQPRVTAALARNLVVYATGGPVAFCDRAAVDRIVAANRGGLRSLILEIALSDLFRQK